MLFCCCGGGLGAYTCGSCSIPTSPPVAYDLIDTAFGRHFAGTMTYGTFAIQGGGTFTDWASPWLASPSGAAPCGYYRIAGLCPSPVLQLAADASGTICSGVGVVNLTMLCPGHFFTTVCSPFSMSFFNGTGCSNPAGMASGVFTQLTKTMGDVYPHLRADPRYAELAARPYPWPPPGPPGLLERAGNLAGAALAHVADGGRMAPPEARAVRRAICEACPHFDGAGDLCRICGCHLSLKRSWASSACPDDPPRWDAV